MQSNPRQTSNALPAATSARADRGMVVQTHGFDHGLGVTFGQDADFKSSMQTSRFLMGNFHSCFRNLSDQVVGLATGGTAALR